MHFRKASTSPIVASASFILKYGSHKYTWRWVHASEKKEMLEEAIHDELGMLWAKLGGT
jgi:hypothetical protein